MTELNMVNIVFGGINGLAAWSLITSMRERTGRPFMWASILAISVFVSVLLWYEIASQKMLSDAQAARAKYRMIHELRLK